MTEAEPPETRGGLAPDAEELPSSLSQPDCESRQAGSAPGAALDPYELIARGMYAHWFDEEGP